MGVTSIFNYGAVRRSPDFKSAMARTRKHYVKVGNCWKFTGGGRQSISEEMDLTKNIEYYKKHGSLPKNTDMQKIQGKGDAYESNRG